MVEPDYNKRSNYGCLTVAAFVFMVWLLFWLAGCDVTHHKLTAREVATASQECYDLDLRAVVLQDGLGNERIACRPHRDDCLHQPR